MSLPTTTTAAVVAHHGEPLELRALPLPATLAPGALLVETSAATLCGTDLELFEGVMSFPDMLPVVLGHESVGRILALGDDAVDALGHPLHVGDRIVWSESTCDRCYACRVLKTPVACEHRGYGFLQRADRAPHAIGGLTRHAVVTPGAGRVRVPDAVPDAVAALCGCAGKTVLHAIDRLGGFRLGETVVIQGSGALGLIATAIARKSGAGTVITIGGPASRIALASEFGADLALDIADGFDAALAAVLEASGGRGADVVLDLAGAPSVGSEAVRLAAQRGRIAIVGTTHDDVDPVPLGQLMMKELTVVGSVNGDVADLRRALTLVDGVLRDLPWDALLSPAVPLSEATAALHAMRAGAIKPVIDPRLPDGPAPDSVGTDHGADPRPSGGIA